MIRQYEAQLICDVDLRKFGLWEKGWRTTFTKSTEFIACCYHEPEKRIQISIPYLNARSEAELRDTIRHEIAHAICGHQAGHGPVWLAKAIELGCKDPKPCAKGCNLDLGRATNIVETKPEKKLKSINLYCPKCHKVFVTKNQTKIGGKVWMIGECGHMVSKEQLPDIGEKIAQWESLSGKQVFPFQVEGIKFVGEANGRALIADEPALGKTIQAIGCLKFYPEMQSALWICKSTLKIQALKEILDWGRHEMIAQVIEHGKMFIMPNMSVYIISMDLLRKIPVEKLEEISYKTVIADEIQHFKNPDSTRTAELRKLVTKAEYFIPLSGTPWKNRGSEYFPVLNMLKPDMFPSPLHFKNKWVTVELDKQTGKFREGGIRNIPEFREKTKSFIIRRMRDDVLPDLPKTDRRVRFVDMDEMYQKAYDKNEASVAARIRDAMIEGRPVKDIAQIIMELKHITGLAKVRVCIEDTEEWLENIPNDFEKLTIFHHHIDVGDNLQKGNPGEYEGIDSWLTKNGYNKSLRLLGGKSPEERDYVVNQFKNKKENRILIASTLASGEGLNLQFCQHAMQLERQWNPQNEEQAELRFSRPLSKGDLPEYLYPLLDRMVSITIPYFIAAGTVDEILTTIVDRKRLNYRRSMNVKDENLQWDEIAIINEVMQEIVKKRYKK